MTTPAVVLTKNPEPLVAVKGVVFAVVHQSTVPVLPMPDVVAPQATATVCPEEPIVIVDPHFLIMFDPSETFCMLSTLIVLVIIIEIYILLLLYLILLHHSLLHRHLLC